jgi:hypothetical protein
MLTRDRAAVRPALFRSKNKSLNKNNGREDAGPCNFKQKTFSKTLSKKLLAKRCNFKQNVATLSKTLQLLAKCRNFKQNFKQNSRTPTHWCTGIEQKNRWSQ